MFKNTTTDFSPFSFILNQLDAHQTRVEMQSVEPPKLPPGRPPKVVIPVTPGAVRYDATDIDRIDNVIHEMDQLELKLQYNRLAKVSLLSPKEIIEKLIEDTDISYAAAYTICKP